ncbi:MAG: NAD(P)-dependent oxidoreductase [Pseudomonadota bacterium]
MRIAVTGTSGRIGRAIHFCLSSDHEVVGIDRALSSATSVVGDIHDVGLLERSFEGAQAVAHTAALHAPHVGIVPDEEFLLINIEGTKNVVTAAKRAGVETLVFTSTTALYGHAVDEDLSRAAWIDEATHPLPKSIYHRTKLTAESYLASEASDQFRITTLRMSRCFPEPAPLMAAYRLHRGVDARDVAEGHRLAIMKPGKPYRTFILSGSTPFKPADGERLRSDAPTILRQRCPELGDAFDKRGWSLPASIDRVYDSALAQNELGWQPRYGFEAVLSLLDSQICEVLPLRSADSWSPTQAQE